MSKPLFVISAILLTYLFPTLRAKAEGDDKVIMRTEL